MKRELFGKNAFGNIYKYTIANDLIELSVIEFGGAIQSLKFKGKQMTLGYDSLEEYENNDGYFGAIIGRYANRIGGGKFTVDGKEYSVFKNDGNNCLHGGKVGFSHVKWQATAGETYVEFMYLSPDGEENFPGNLQVKVKYSLLSDGVEIEYEAVSDKSTAINLTNHTYFNLDGGTYPILDHKLKIEADHFTPINADLVPTGEIGSVENTVFDFRSSKKISDGINADDEQIKLAGGYDHNFVLNGQGYRKFAEVFSEQSGVTMDCYTDLPGVQFYSGNFMTRRKIEGERQTDRRCGLCLETQFSPNAINIPAFPSTVLPANKVFKSKTSYRFK